MFPALTVILLLVASVMPSPDVISDPPPNPATLNGGSVMTSVLTITQDNKTTVTRYTTSAASQAVAPAARPANAYLYCNQPYTFTDANVSFYIQHACGGTTGPWGIKISSAVCAGASSSVSESGMTWARNGATMASQAPHNQACSYTFHGTFNPDRDGDHISYVDVLRFRVGANGKATLQVYGDFTTTGSSCSPTSC